MKLAQGLSRKAGRSGLALVGLISSAAFVSLFSRAAFAADKKVVVILPFEAPSSELGASAVESFGNQLVESKKVRVVERGKLDKVMKEHELNMSGFVDPATVKRAIGKALAADFVVMGRVSSSGDGYTLSARLVNLESAEIEAAKEIPFRDLKSQRVAVKALAKQFLGEITGEAVKQTGAEAMLSTNAKHFYSAAEMLTDHLSRLWSDVEGEIAEHDPSDKSIVVSTNRSVGELPVGMKLEVFRDEVSGKQKVAEIFVTKSDDGEKTFNASYLKKSGGGEIQLGDKVSSSRYKARIAIGGIVDEAEDNEALVAKFRETVSARLRDMDHMGSVDYDDIGEAVLDLGGGGREKKMKELFKKGVDYVVLGKFYGTPGDRRTDFKVHSAYTSKIVLEVKIDTEL